MYSFPSRSHRRQPFARFIAIGYGPKYFTLAVTPPGIDRRARAAYAFEVFVFVSKAISFAVLAIGFSHPLEADIVFAPSVVETPARGSGRAAGVAPGVCKTRATKRIHIQDVPGNCESAPRSAVACSLDGGGFPRTL